MIRLCFYAPWGLAVFSVHYGYGWLAVCVGIVGAVLLLWLGWRSARDPRLDARVRDALRWDTLLFVWPPGWHRRAAAMWP